MVLSDREALMAIFNAVTALGERVTGERMVVRIETDDGQSVYATGGNVRWEPINQEAAEEPRAVRPAQQPTRQASCSARRASG